MTDGERPLPVYDRPPVVETAIGVEFDRIEKLTVPYFGLFWSRIRSEFPRSEVHPPIIPPARNPNAVRLVFGASSRTVRCWFYDDTETRLIQVQQEQFIYNWRKRPVEPNYPRYEKVRPIFETNLEIFRQFLRDEGLLQPAVKRCTVTYINHVEKGSGWNNFSDLSDVVTCWSCGESAGVLPAPKSAAFGAEYEMPEGGDLTIEVQPAVRMSDGKEVLQLSLVGAVSIKEDQQRDLLELIDRCHGWVVRGFDAITTEKMHNIWGKKAMS